MKPYIFLGPSLSLEEARRHLDAEYCPPVRQGDVLRLLRQDPAVIGIVDGDFDGRVSVWHKEILLAMSQGVRVFGASCMGALRAAELHSFSMGGVGRIFAAFRDGHIEDDDEVAITYRAAGSDFIPLSEAMVNIRDAVEAAVRENLISPDLGTGLVAIAKRLHYTQRTYSRIFELANGMIDGGLPDSLADFLTSHHPRLTAQDATAMLDRIAEFIAGPFVPLHIPYTVERTVFLESAIEENKHNCR